MSSTKIASSSELHFLRSWYHQRLTERARRTCLPLPSGDPLVAAFCFFVAGEELAELDGAVRGVCGPGLPDSDSELEYSRLIGIVISWFEIESCVEEWEKTDRLIEADVRRRGYTHTAVL